MIYSLLSIMICVSASFDYSSYCAVPGCEHCLTEETCDVCNDSFWLHDGSCIPCRQALPWCNRCDYNNKVCFECQYGFYLASDYSCGFCQTDIPNCKSCKNTTHGPYCEECHYPWSLYDGKCKYSSSTGGDGGSGEGPIDSSNAWWNFQISEPEETDSWNNW